jgi:hypothetical protein
MEKKEKTPQELEEEYQTLLAQIQKYENYSYSSSSYDVSDDDDILLLLILQRLKRRRRLALQYMEEFLRRDEVDSDLTESEDDEEYIARQKAKREKERREEAELEARNFTLPSAFAEPSPRVTVIDERQQNVNLQERKSKRKLPSNFEPRRSKRIAETKKVGPVSFIPIPSK